MLLAVEAREGLQVEFGALLGGEEFTGKIVFVHPEVEAGGQYRVWAEVVNRAEGDQWLLRPGLDAEMDIDLAAE